MYLFLVRLGFIAIFMLQVALVGLHGCAQYSAKIKKIAIQQETIDKEASKISALLKDPDFNLDNRVYAIFMDHKKNLEHTSFELEHEELNLPTDITLATLFVLICTSLVTAVAYTVIRDKVLKKEKSSEYKSTLQC